MKPVSLGNRAAVLLASCSMTSLMAMSPAQAQTAPSQGPAAPKADDAAPASDADIVVTGSKVVRNGYEQPTPVTVLTSTELLTKQPTTLAEGLALSPQFVSVTGRSFAVQGVSPGAYLNLRGLGATRMLVLLDGDRVTDSREQGGVDANILPELLTQRVDVVTGGASAAYGSDAVAGVVNYVTDNKFSGVKAIAQAGVAGRGYDDSYKVGVAFGKSFWDDRLHVIGSAQYFRQNGIASGTQVPFINQSWFQAGNGTTTPYSFVSGIAQNDGTFGGVILNSSNLPVANTAAPLAGTNFTSATTTAPFTFGSALAGNTQQFTVGGDGANLLGHQAILAKAVIKSFFGRAELELSETLRAYFRVNVADSKSIQAANFSSAIGSRAVTIFSGNPFIPAALQQTMTTQGIASFRLGRQTRDMRPVVNDYDTDSVDVAFGFKGKIGDRWSWSAGYSYGRTKLLGLAKNNLLLANFYAAADAVRDPVSGQTVCRVTLTNPGAFPGCVPINLFGEGTPSEAATNYTHGTSTQRVRNEQQVATAQLNGKLFTLPGGSVNVALGGEYRYRKLTEAADALSLATLQVPGIRGVPTRYCPTATSCQIGSFISANFGNADASDDVKEAFGEILAPILGKDSPLGSLEFNGAVRYTDYSTSGSVTTWKAGLEWSPIPDIRFRSTRSRDIRAPNLYELFAGPVGSSSVTISDGAFGSYTVATQNRGNNTLKPEKANTWTVGTVLAPRFIPGLKASVDLYWIDINGALAPGIGAQQTINNCALGDSVACANIIRNPADNRILNILLQTINLNQMKVNGIDAELSYETGLLGGRLNIRALGSKITKYSITSGGVTRELSGIGNNPVVDLLSLPDWRGDVELTYANGPVTVGVNERLVGPIDIAPGVGKTFATGFGHIGTYGVTNLSLTINIGDHYQLFGIVNNLLNKTPPIVANTVAAGVAIPTIPSLYDIEGRYFSGGVRLRF